MSVKRRKDKDRANRETTFLGSVILACISAILGFILGIVHMASQPVEEVREMPPLDQIDAGVVYFVQGQERGGNSYKPKEKTLLEAKPGILRLNEAELNTWARDNFRFSRGPKAPGEPEPGMFTVAVLPGTPNFRLADDMIQISMSLEVEAFGQGKKKVRFQTKGVFDNLTGVPRFVPQETHLGSARIPEYFLAGFAFDHLLSMFESHEKFIDYYDAWAKIADMKVSGNQLAVTIP